jgi:dTMP kinase
MLEKGNIVISDRYIESSLAYQVAQGLDPTWVLEINKYAIQPDMNIILDIDPKTALKRKEGKKSTKFENVDFLKKVRGIFLERAKIKNYIVIDTTEPINKVQEKIRKIVSTLLQRKLI